MDLSPLFNPSNEDIKEDKTGNKTRAQVEREKDRVVKERPIIDGSRVDETEVVVKENESEDYQEAEPDEDVEPEKELDVDIHVDDDAISESFDHIVHSETTVDDMDESSEALMDVVEEIEDVQDALEAMKENVYDATPTLTNMVDKSLARITYRLGTEFKTVSCEGHVGDKYVDMVFVESLEASISQTLRTIIQKFKQWLKDAMNAARKIWYDLTNVSKRINAKAVKAAKSLKDNPHTEEDLKRLAEKVSEVTRPVDWFINTNGVMKLEKDHASALAKRLSAFETLVKADQEKAEDFLKTTVDNANLSMYSEYQTAKDRRDTVLKTALEYYESVVEKTASDDTSALIGNARFVVSEGIQAKVVVRNGEAKEPDKGQLSAMLAEYATDPKALLKLAEFTANATARNSVLSKDFDREQKKFYDELNKDAEDLVKEYMETAKKAGSDQADNRIKMSMQSFPAITSMRIALTLGYSATRSGRTQWLRSLSSLANALVIFTVPKKTA